MIRERLWHLAQSPAARTFMESSTATHEIASRYIAGSSPESALAQARRLNEMGLGTTLAFLDPKHEFADATNVDVLDETIKRLADSGPSDNELSIDLDQIGLGSDLDRATKHVSYLLDVAKDHEVKVTFDIGPIDQVPDAIALFQRFQESAFDLGISLQTRLHRTRDDIARLATPNTRIRLSSGLYPAPDEYQYRRGQQRCLTYVQCMRDLMESPAYPIIATHDRRIIEIAAKLATSVGKSSAEYEFQIIQGVRPIEQRRLVDTGHQCRVYLPFGEHWYQYVSRWISAHPLSWIRMRFDQR